jgi:ABC-type glycerol-3-phosphate transport system substrate-binding protein
MVVGGMGGLLAACARAKSGSSVPTPVVRSATIEVWKLAQSQVDEPAYKNLFDLLRREVPQVTPNVVEAGGIDKLQTTMAAGTPPDIASAIILELGTIYARNLAIPAHELLRRTKTWQPEGFLPGLRASHSYKGQMVTVPMVTGKVLRR